jgi:hypothetical protein
MMLGHVGTKLSIDRLSLVKAESGIDLVCHEVSV